MADPQEIPDLVTELVDLSKEYVRQETIEPLKKVGTHAGFGVAAGVLFAFGALFVVLGAYAGFRAALPEGEWWTVLSRFLTVLVAGGGAGIVAWRMTR